MIFRLILELFGLLLGRLWDALWLPLAAFGLHWDSPWPHLAPIFFGPSGCHPEPFQRHGLILEVFSLTLGRLWAPFWLPLPAFGLPLGLSLDALGPHFGRPTFELMAFVLVRLSPDECWRTPVESKRIL